MRKKKLLALLIILALILIPFTALAYDRVPWKFAGWSIYRLTHATNVINSSRIIAGLDNSKSPVSAPYTCTQTVTESWSKGGSLSSSISGSSSGLGAEISSSISWSFTQSLTTTQTYGPVTVPAFSSLKLWGDFYGNRTSGLAKHFVAGISTKQGTYEVRSVYAMVFRPQWTYPFQIQ